jgi:hypothetical protein
MSYNYYQSEVDNLPSTDLNLQIRGEGGQTKWIGLNVESIPIIIKKLQQEKKRLIIKEGK